VTDLAAVERGARIIIQSPFPNTTTEDLPIRGDPDVTCWLPAPAGAFDAAVFMKSADRITAITRRPPLAMWKCRWEIHGPVGRDRSAGQRTGGHNAGWSNFVKLEIVPRCHAGGLTAANGPDSVLSDVEGALRSFAFSASWWQSRATHWRFRHRRRLHRGQH